MIPVKTIDISPTKTIIIGVINQVSYLGGTTLQIYPVIKHGWRKSPYINGGFHGKIIYNRGLSIAMVNHAKYPYHIRVLK
jgi:hypothetical protein